MSQSDFLKETMSDFFDELDSEGLDESGVYTAPAGTPVDGCRGIINRGVAATDGSAFTRAVGHTFIVRLLLSDIPTPPVRGATWAIQSIAFGTETFKLVEPLGDDGALSTWQVEYA